MARACLLTLLLLATQPVASWSWPSRDGPPPNVRPFFGAGYSIPVWDQEYDRGYGFGAGFEIEQTSYASFLLRIEWHRLHDGQPRAAYSYPHDSYYPLHHSPQLSAIDWAVGGRGYLTTGIVRPYAEACVGVRLMDKRVAADGVGFTLRLGMSFARPGGAGMFLDSGLNLAVKDANHYGIVPARLGIVFP
jgi:hypothetical protein